MLGTTNALRLLHGPDRAAALELLARDPVPNVFLAARLLAAGRDMRGLGGELWGYTADDELASLCFAGANVVPSAGGRAAVEAFADRAVRQGRRCSSVVGPADVVAPLWDLLEPVWGAARDVRRDQPLMATSKPAPVSADPLVRRVRPDELDLLMPACVAMFTEEVGVSPLLTGGEPLYRARVAELISSGRAFARIEDGQVVFKAEIGAVTPQTCQVQGVWVAPELRGRGLSVAGMAAVVGLSLDEVAPSVSLYVNAYNTAARAAYRRVGFAEVGTFMSVLF